MMVLNALQRNKQLSKKSGRGYCQVKTDSKMELSLMRKMGFGGETRFNCNKGNL